MIRTISEKLMTLSFLLVFLDSNYLSLFKDLLQKLLILATYLTLNLWSLAIIGFLDDLQEVDHFWDLAFTQFVNHINLGPLTFDRLLELHLNSLLN